MKKGKIKDPKSSKEPYKVRKERALFGGKKDIHTTSERELAPTPKKDNAHGQLNDSSYRDRSVNISNEVELRHIMNQIGSGIAVHEHSRARAV